MTNILLSLTPFIFIIFLGYTLGYLKIFDQQNARSLNLFLFYVAIPALIVKIVTESNIGDVAQHQLFSYFLMQIICGSGAFYLTRIYFKKGMSEALIWALTVALCNHVLLILPITKVFFTEDVSFQVSSIIVMDCVLLISIITFFLEVVSHEKFQLKLFLKRIFFNPLILSILFSSIVKVLDLNFGTGPVNYTLTKLSECTMPVGLLALGIILSQVSSNIINTLTLSIAFLKLIMSPLLLFFFGFIFFDAKIYDLEGALLVSVGPCGAMALAFCAAYNVSPDGLVKAIFLSTALSLVSIILMIQLL